jgi:hypothetical protein
VTKANKRFCNECGAKVVEYKHGLSKGLLRGLFRLAQAGGGPINIRTIGLTVDQLTNFQKLKYWNLVVKSNPKSTKGGDWHITDVGWAFLRGQITLSKYVWSFRGAPIRFDGPFVRFDQIN